MALPLFRLPILVIKLVLETMGFIEIFLLTCTSTKSKRIFKNLVRIRNHQMLLFLRKTDFAFNFETHSDPLFDAPIHLASKEIQPNDDVFLLRIGSSEHVPSRLYTSNGKIRLVIYWNARVTTATKLYNALFDVFKMPLDGILMKLNNVALGTCKSWIKWNNDLFSDIPFLEIKGKCSFSIHSWILKNVRTNHKLNFLVEPTQYPNNPNTIEISNVGAVIILITHGKWINTQQLNSIKAQEINIWEVSLTDVQINTILRDWKASEVASNWKQIKIHFNREAVLEVVLERIDVIDEDPMKPDDALNQWSFELANGKKCTMIYALYRNAEHNDQYGFEFLFGN